MNQSIKQAIINQSDLIECLLQKERQPAKFVGTVVWCWLGPRVWVSPPKRPITTGAQPLPQGHRARYVERPISLASRDEMEKPERRDTAIIAGEVAKDGGDEVVTKTSPTEAGRVSGRVGLILGIVPVLVFYCCQLMIHSQLSRMETRY